MVVSDDEDLPGPVVEETEEEEGQTEHCYELQTQDEVNEEEELEEEASEEIDTEEEEVVEDEEEIKDEFEIITKKQYQLFDKGEAQVTVEEPIQVEEEIKEAEEIIEEEPVKEVIPEVIEEVEKVEEVEEPVIEEREPMVHEIEYDENQSFDTALETRYNSLNLKEFPIKSSNIPSGIEFPYVKALGTTKLRVGDQYINNCHLKIVSNDTLKILKIKHREFKLAISVSLSNDTIVASGIVRSYEISSLIKYSRMLKVLEMLEQIFSGAPISFKMNRLYGDITANDEIELMRIHTIQKFFATLRTAEYRFQMSNLPKSPNVYYLLELYAAYKEERVVETWCNYKLNSENLDLRVGDSLVLTRKHKFDEHQTLIEKVTIKNPLDKKGMFTGKVVGYRKPCLVEVSKAEN